MENSVRSNQDGTLPPARQSNSMMKLLAQYHQKLTAQEGYYRQRLGEIKKTVMQQFVQRFEKQFNQFQKQFDSKRHHFDADLKTLQYYLQNFIQKHSLNPKENNLYPLFNQIDKKIFQNCCIFEQKFGITFIFPENRNEVKKDFQFIKLQILQKEIKEMRIFMKQNEKIAKLCAKQIELFEQIHLNYEKIYTMAERRIFTSDLKYTGNIQQCLLMLEMHSKIQKLSLWVRSQNGKLGLKQYERLFERLKTSRGMLSELELGIMDMEFEQGKCELVKRFVKGLRSFRIQNYYKENKLGMFEDFNWAPLKKDVHVVGRCW